MADPLRVHCNQEDVAQVLENLAAGIRQGEIFVETYALTHQQHRELGEIERNTIGVDLQLVELLTCEP